jgi:hypothetical protein
MIFIEMLVVAHPAKQFPALQATGMFITLFTNVLPLRLIFSPFNQGSKLLLETLSFKGFSCTEARETLFAVRRTKIPSAATCFGTASLRSTLVG